MSHWSVGRGLRFNRSYSDDSILSHMNNASKLCNFVLQIDIFRAS